jgi:hypothetical protein
LAEGHVHHDNREPNLALGEEVLTDCLLLARCESLVHINSNVATAAGYINPALKMVFCETPGQAAWGYIWSICLSKTRLDFIARRLCRFLKASPRRTRKLVRLIGAGIAVRLSSK